MLFLLMNHRRGANHHIIEALHARKFAKALSILFGLVTIGFHFAAAVDQKAPRVKKMTTINNGVSVDDDEYELMNGEQWWSSNMIGSLCCASCFGFKFDAHGDTTTIIEGTAFDIIVVEGEDGNLFQNSDFLVRFKDVEDESHKIVMEVDQGDEKGAKAWFPIIRKPTEETEGNQIESDSGDEHDTFDEERFWGCCHPSAGFAKPNILSKFNDGGVEDIDDPSLALKSFLKPGRNPVRYLLLNEQRVVGVAKANMFLWKYSDSIVVCDIDGTITKTNTVGIFGTIMTEQYEKVCHEGICKMLSRLSESSQVVYLTSRPLLLANHTRKFLSTLQQGNSTLPVGPLLGFGGNMLQLAMMELVKHTTQQFKAGKLWQQVVQPFRKATKNDDNYPFFVAGFGNNFMDMQSYHAVGMDLNRMFKISKQSKIVTFDRLGLNSERYNGVDFPSYKWYKERIGTEFDGYEDESLISRLETKNSNSESLIDKQNI